MTAERRRAWRNTLSDALRRSVRRSPQKEALVYGGRRWTYRELDQGANRVAHYLLQKGLKPGDRLSAYGRNSDSYVLLWLGCLRAGIIHVPINYMLTGEELLYIVRQSGSSLLVFDESLRGPVEQVADRLSVKEHLTFGEILAAATDERYSSEEPDVDLHEEAVAQILYTSGTTTLPKGAMLTHRSLLSEYLSCIVNLDQKPEDRSLHALPLYHSAQMHVFLMPQLLVGATSFVVEGPSPDITFPILEKEDITSFFAPPTVWIQYLRREDFHGSRFPHLKKAYYGASIMPVPVLQELRERLPGVGPYNCYGQTEIAPLATVLRPEEHDERPASAGRPVLLVETRVVNEKMEDVPPGELGEIVHRSPHLMIGYWEKEEETQEAFAGGWFHSGDLGYMDEAGYLYVVDRVKDVINTGGVLVASREVEEALYTHDAVSEVAVIALPDPVWIEKVTAVVVLKKGKTATEEELIQHARSRLAPFKVPKKVYFVEDLPRNASGKILKRELRDRFAKEES
ncbi:MAG: acyl-CoA synthetase [Clostridiales bacterium]|nr:acyl-CoA synthetase [Clostridiales bacterium]